MIDLAILSLAFWAAFFLRFEGYPPFQEMKRLVFLWPYVMVVQYACLAALGVPSFAWFGPTHPDTWNPPGEAHGFWRTELPCRACDLTACPHWNCLPALAPDAGAALVLAHLERHPRHG